ncbi:MAG: TAXI family TRAP transporter solute-binding subunit [Hyphomicrobiales bacterium]
MRNALGALAIASIFSASIPVYAQSRDQLITLNQNTVGIMADTAGSLGMALNFARALDHENDLRLLPMAGKGPVQTLTDVIYLRGVDAAILPSDTLAYAVNNQLLEGAPARLSFIAKLASLDVHVLARGSVKTLADLAGKRVAAGSTGSGSFIAASLIFPAAGVTIDEVPLEDAEAIAALKRGDVDAVVIVSPRPAALLHVLKQKDGLHLVSVPAGGNLWDFYAPAILSSADYPGLLRRGESVETAASSLVLAVFNAPRNSERYYKLRRFTDALFDSLMPEDGAAAGINLAADVPGWTRYVAAQEWLDARRGTAQAKYSMTIERED